MIILSEYITKRKKERMSRFNLNPYLCKKGFYLTDCEFDTDGLSTTIDRSGPYKSLENAKKAYVKAIKGKTALDIAGLSVRGPEYMRKNKFNDSQYETIWYSIADEWRKEFA